MGFRAGSLFERPAIGISLKDIESKLTKFIPGASPAAVPVTPPPAPPQDTVLGVPPTVAALGGLGILGTIAAVVFGHH